MKYLIFLQMLVCCFVVQAQQKDSLRYKNGVFEIYTQKAIYQDSVLYDTKIDHKRILEIEEEGNTDCAKGIKIHYNPLSLLGDFYSFERLRYDLGGGSDCNRNPSSEIAVKTIHIKTQTTVSLLELVDEKSLIAALKKDTWVRNMYGVMDTVQLDDKNTFKDILQLINQNIAFGNAFSTNSFALHSYNRKTKLLAVRLIGIEYMGYNHSKKLQLGLLLKPKDYIREELEKEEGFFMGKF